MVVALCVSKLIARSLQLSGWKHDTPASSASLLVPIKFANYFFSLFVSSLHEKQS